MLPDAHPIAPDAHDFIWTKRAANCGRVDGDPCGIDAHRRLGTRVSEQAILLVDGERKHAARADFTVEVFNLVGAIKEAAIQGYADAPPVQIVKFRPVLLNGVSQPSLISTVKTLMPPPPPTPNGPFVRELA